MYKCRALYSAAIDIKVATKMNIGCVFEKERINRAAREVTITPGRITSLLIVSRILPPVSRARTSTTAIAEKKYPGFATPHLIAYSGKKAFSPPHAKLNRKETIAGATIFFSKKNRYPVIPKL